MTRNYRKYNIDVIYFWYNLSKEDKVVKKGSKFGKFLAFVGALTIIGGICFLIYKLTKPDYLDEYDDDDYDDID